MSFFFCIFFFVYAAFEIVSMNKVDYYQKGLRQPSTDSSATSTGHIRCMVGRSLSPVRRRATQCRNVYATLLTVLLFLAVFSKQFSSRSILMYAAHWRLWRGCAVAYKLTRYTLHYTMTIFRSPAHGRQAAVTHPDDRCRHDVIRRRAWS